MNETSMGINREVQISHQLRERSTELVNESRELTDQLHRQLVAPRLTRTLPEPLKRPMIRIGDPDIV